MIPQLKSIFNTNQVTSLINLLTKNVNNLIAGKEDVANKQNSLAADVTNTKYPTVTAVNTGLALKLNLTGGTMSGAIAMGTSKITGLGQPTSNQDAATKLYVDTTTSTAAATKQDLFDYSGSGSGAIAVTIDDVKGGVAEFTQSIVKKTTQSFRINSNIIEATSKIIPVLIYDGSGYPVILSQKLASGRIDFLVANIDVTGSGGADTDSNIFIEYQIVG